MTKKVFVFFFGLIFALSLAGLALAQAKPEKPAEAMKPAEAAKPGEAAKPEETKKEEVKKKAPPKPVEFFMGGIVLAVDDQARKLTIEQHQVVRTRKLILNVSKKQAQELARIHVGDAVNVWVTGRTVTRFEKVY
jgi:hypothetical protein